MVSAVSNKYLVRFDFLERAGIEYMEYLMSERKDMCPFIFTFDECNQLFKVWFVEFFL